MVHPVQSGTSMGVTIFFYTHTQTYIHAYIYIYIYIYIHTCAHTYIHTYYVYIYIYAYILHTHTLCAHIHTYRYIDIRYRSRHPFIRTFLGFDILPLVEFQPETDIALEEAWSCRRASGLV